MLCEIEKSSDVCRTASLSEMGHEQRAATSSTVNVIVAGFRKGRDLVREGKVFIKDKAKVASRVGYSERRVVNFRKLLFTSDKKKLSFRRVESKNVCSHPGRDLL